MLTMAARAFAESVGHAATGVARSGPIAWDFPNAAYFLRSACFTVDFVGFHQS
jgi:hypothetical protein